MIALATRRLLPIAGALLALAAAGWSGFWFYARARAASTFAELRETSPGAPIAIRCASQSYGGFPLDITITCNDPGVTMAGDAGPVTMRLSRITVTTRLTDARDQTVELTGPLTATDALGGAKANWNNMVVGMRGVAPDYDSLVLRGEGLTVDCGTCGDALRDARLAALEITAQRRGDTKDFSFTATMSGVTSALLSRFTGGQAPASVAAAGLITQAEVPTSLRLAPELERWRRDGGELLIDALSMDQDALHAELSGRFAIDAAHRLAGRFDLNARNAATLLATFTGSLNPLLQMGFRAILRRVDDGGSRSGGSTIRLSGTIENGALSLGPVRGIVTVPPLY